MAKKGHDFHTTNVLTGMIISSVSVMGEAIIYKIIDANDCVYVVKSDKNQYLNFEQPIRGHEVTLKVWKNEFNELLVLKVLKVH